MTDNIRYPIGTFEAPKTITQEDRRTWVQQIDDLPGMLRRAVEDLGEQQFDTPYREGGWTIRQVVHHIPDSHLNGYVRFRWALTEENPTIKTYLQPRWAELPDARSGPVELSLELAEALHRRWVYLLRAMSEEDWRRSFVHPESGAMPLERMAGHYAWHGRHHLGHIMGLRTRKGW